MVLVLSRERNESIMIGDNIVVTIFGIQGGRVRLGISAPQETRVHRQEVYEEIKRERDSCGTDLLDALPR